MRMSLADQVAYPKFARYVKNEIPKVADNKYIAAAFRKYGQIDGVAFKNALKWENSPVIKVTHLIGAYGEYTPGIGSDEIRIQDDIVRDFEAGIGIKKTKSGKSIYLVGATLLHEMIHWADDKDGKDYPGEEGKLFEKEVYGMIIG